MCKDFSERTDSLSYLLRCSLRDLAGKIGISQAMLFAYRSGKSEPTLKALRKLEAAERAAGIPQDTSGAETGNAGSSGKPKDSPGGNGEKVSGEADPFSLQAQIDAIKAQLQHVPFTLAELEARMRLAGAWPASPEDGHLTPAQLWQKYAPATGL